MPIAFVVQLEMRPESPRNVAIELTKLGFVGIQLLNDVMGSDLQRGLRQL